MKKLITSLALCLFALNVFGLPSPDFQNIILHGTMSGGTTSTVVTTGTGGAFGSAAFTLSGAYAPASSGTLAVNAIPKTGGTGTNLTITGSSTMAGVTYVTGTTLASGSGVLTANRVVATSVTGTLTLTGTGGSAVVFSVPQYALGLDQALDTGADPSWSSVNAYIYASNGGPSFLMSTSGTTDLWSFQDVGQTEKFVITNNDGTGDKYIGPPAGSNNLGMRFNNEDLYLGGGDGNAIHVDTAGLVTVTGTAAAMEFVGKGAAITGMVATSGTVQTTFTVDIGATMSGTTYKSNAEGKNALSSAIHYTTNQTTTTFDVVYITGLSGAVVFDWFVFP